MPRPIAQVLLRRLLATVAALCIALPALAATPSAPLRVMSFNVRVPVDTDGDKRWQARRDAMVALIRQAHPNVVGTQELVHRSRRGILQRTCRPIAGSARDAVPTVAVSTWACSMTAAC